MCGPVGIAVRTSCSVSLSIGGHDKVTIASQFFAQQALGLGQRASHHAMRLTESKRGWAATIGE